MEEKDFIGAHKYAVEQVSCCSGLEVPDFGWQSFYVRHSVPSSTRIVAH